MKKLFLSLLAAVLALAGCTKNSPDPSSEYSNEEIDGFLQEVFWDQVDVPEYEVISEQTFTPEELLDAVFGSNGELDGEELEIKEAFLKKCDEKLEELREEEPDGAIALLFRSTNFKYHTIDQKGDRIELSAFMGWAVYKVLWKIKPYDQNHVLLCCPYTHTKEDECATASKGGKEFLTMWHDNLFIMPDGQGFGENKNNVQTYLNHNLHAKQYYDALKVGQKLYLEEYGDLEDDWTLRVVGASQGAGDGIALHKFLDTQFDRLDLTKYYESENPVDRVRAKIICSMYGYPEGTKIIEVPFRNLHRFEYSYVCCGPYCPEVTMRTYSEWDKLSYPCVIPLVIKSMLSCYSDFLVKEKGYKEEDFFSNEWNMNKADFDDIYLKKTMNSDNLNIYICQKLGVELIDVMPPVPLSKILSEDMRKTDSQIYKDLITCLKKQDLTSGWTPKTKTKLYFSEIDEVVPYANTKKLIQLFQSENCTYKTVKDHFGHVDTCTDYMTSSWDW